MPRVSIEALAQTLRDGQAKLVQKLDKGLERAADRGRNLLMKRTPVGIAGEMRNAWSEPRRIAGEELGYEVINDAPHAAIVEFGSQPHMPPVEPIILWAQRKFSLSEEEARKVGWAVAMKIKAEGTRPQHVALGAEDELRRFVVEEVARATRSR